MTAFHTEAIKLNNEGVAQIEAGNYGAARSKFRKALELIKSSTLRSKRKLSDTAEASSVGLRWSTKIPLRTQQVSADDDTSAAASFTYSRALSIVPFSEGETMQACVTETVSMLYNLSLSFHLEGQLKNSSALMSKALKAYKIALTFRRKQKQCKKLRGDRLIDVAINNNMAMIYQEFVDYQSARKCFTQVSRGLRTFGTSGFLDQTEYHGLVLNLMMSRQNENHSAAAA